jgi:hypothetical protein
MNDRLHEYDAATPSMQEVEVLVWNAGDECENALAGAEQNGERREGVGQGTDTIGEAAQASPSIMVGSALDGCYPCLVDDANKPGNRSAMSKESCRERVAARKDE